MSSVTQAKVQVATLSVISNTTLVIGKIVAGLATGSVSILSEAIHSGLDLIAAMIAYFSVKEAGKPADDRHRYGHGKIENISGTVEALLIVVAAIWISYEAIGKLKNGGHVEQIGWGVAIMGVSAVVNIIVSSRLLKVAKATDSVALAADAMHLKTDVYTSFGVMLGLLLIKLTGISLLDPLVALVVALLVLKAGWDLTKQAFFPLVDVSLPQEEEEIIIAVIESFSTHYLEFHKLRTRKAGSERHIDLHLVVPKESPVREVHTLCDIIEDEIENRLPGSHVLIHIEPCKGSSDCNNCDTISRQCQDET
jgi:cation diffusion facilitator family transporter